MCTTVKSVYTYTFIAPYIFVWLTTENFMCWIGYAYRNTEVGQTYDISS